MRKLIMVLFFVIVLKSVAAQTIYPNSTFITDITFDTTSYIEKAIGSDNWPTTWGSHTNDSEGVIYTSWGDGGGFDGENSKGRVSLGFGKITGTPPILKYVNVWGGLNFQCPAQFNGKSYGIVAIDGTLYKWRSPGSNIKNYEEARLYKSLDHGCTWTATNVKYSQNKNFILPSIIQFGKDYSQSLDNYVYMYPTRLKDATALKIQKPGRIDLARVLKSEIEDKSKYEFFTGLDANDNPMWTSNVDNRKPVFEINSGVGWAPAVVSYNKPLDRYILAVDRGNSGTSGKGLGIYDAPKPWGPWTTVKVFDNWIYEPTFFYNFPTKWISSDGKTMWMVFSGTGDYDSFNLIKATLTTSNVGSVCGNDNIENDEVCDSDSKSCITNGYSGQQDCNSFCTGYNSCATNQYCGDNILNGNEECDDGNTNSNDGCDSTCRTESTPSNNLVGDLNDDKVVDLKDVFELLVDFGKRLGFKQKNDITSDGEVNLFDLVKIAKNFGKVDSTIPPAPQPAPAPQPTPQPAPSPQPTPAPQPIQNISGLIAHWELDENNGSFASDSAKDNDGIITGATWNTGINSAALKFDGANDYVEIPDNDMLDLNSEFTIAAWINPKGWGDSNQGRIIDHGGGSGNKGWSFQLYSKDGAKALMIQINNNGVLYKKNNVIELNKWQHVAATLENSKLTLYVNGVNVKEYSNVPTPTAKDTPIRIGIRATDLKRDFDGRIDDIRIYNIPLSQAEISALIN